VEGTEGEWVGVEWDDPTRGKHDGSHAGVRYFECAASSEGGAAPGSFVRAHKIRPSISFAQAIQAKYLDGQNVAGGKGGGGGGGGATGAKASKGKDGDASGGGGDEESAGQFVRSSNGKKIEIQLCLKKDDPGLVLNTLDRIYLNDAAIHTAGAPGEAAGCGVDASRLAILDLAGNLMPDWPAVARFGEEFPNLANLDLTGVRAAWPTTPPLGLSPFPALSVLILNRSGVTWTQAAALAAALPSLEELSIGGCGIARLGDGAGPLAACAAAGFAGLTALNLENNALEDWEHVERLAFLPKLERLHLGGNKLTRVAYPAHLITDAAEGDAAPPAVPFALLKGLFFADNAVHEWESVDALNDFPAMAEVRLTGNPVTESAATRHEIVARVGRLSQLNGSLIADQERKDAEIRYLRRVLSLVKNAGVDLAVAPSGDGAATAGAGGGAGAGAGGGGGAAGAGAAQERAPQRGSEAVAANHPRLQALLGSYGELSTHTTRGPGTGKMGEDMLQLTLTCVAASAGEKAPQVKKVPMTMTVGKLKLLCEKLFKVKADAQQLFYKEPFMGMPELLEPDDYDISYLGVRDGAKILVGDKNE
jgi:hypothetical protein